MNPDYFMVLPWHFRQGIVQKESAYLERGGQLIFPLPALEVVSGAVTPSSTAAPLSTRSSG